MDNSHDYNLNKWTTRRLGRGRPCKRRRSNKRREGTGWGRGCAGTGQGRTPATHRGTKRSSTEQPLLVPPSFYPFAPPLGLWHCGLVALAIQCGLGCLLLHIPLLPQWNATSLLNQHNCDSIAKISIQDLIWFDSIWFLSDLSGCFIFLFILVLYGCMILAVWLMSECWAK